MGTRSLTVFKEEDGTEIVVLYRQLNGYPIEHGKHLAGFLAGKPIVNGIGSAAPQDAFNTMGCLAAQVVAHFKTGIGDFYLYPAGSRDCGEEYIYEVSGKEGDNEAHIKATAVYGTTRWSFSGPASQFTV